MGIYDSSKKKTKKSWVYMSLFCSTWYFYNFGLVCILCIFLFFSLSLSLSLSIYIYICLMLDRRGGFLDGCLFQLILFYAVSPPPPPPLANLFYIFKKRGWIDVSAMNTRGCYSLRCNPSSGTNFK